MRKVLFCGVDVDDNAFHFAIADNLSNEIKDYVCDPNASALGKKLKEIIPKGVQVKICYEAGYLGTSLCRQLRALGFDCEIIAPSLMPRQPGKKQKTDRIDCRKLAQYYMNGLLTIIHIPGETQEADRDLLRSRKFLVEQLTSLKAHIMHFCRRLGRDFCEEAQKKSTWTQAHLEWLEKIAKTHREVSVKINLTILLREYQHLRESIELYDSEIDHIADRKEYNSKVKSLNCYRGLDTASSLTIVLELGDILRFDHPRRLTSYAGLDIVEYSSGGREQKFSISKNGNHHIRRTLIEACQFAIRPPKPSKALKARRQGAKEEWITIADRCMTRLHKKGTRLLYANKQKNKIKVACAREMLGFIWESLRAAS